MELLRQLQHKDLLMETQRRKFAAELDTVKAECEAMTKRELNQMQSKVSAGELQMQELNDQNERHRVKLSAQVCCGQSVLSSPVSIHIQPLFLTTPFVWVSASCVGCNHGISTGGSIFYFFNGSILIPTDLRGA